MNESQKYPPPPTIYVCVPFIHTVKVSSTPHCNIDNILLSLFLLHGDNKQGKQYVKHVFMNEQTSNVLNNNNIIVLNSYDQMAEFSLCMWEVVGSTAATTCQTYIYE